LIISKRRRFRAGSDVGKDLKEFAEKTLPIIKRHRDKEQTMVQ
jgi:hypothetical protein